MARKVTWTNISWNDLEETSEYIARDSANYAAAFVHEVREAARSLTIFSERGRVVPETNDPNIRELFVRNYRLIYQITKSEIYILAFIHGARDLRKFWEKP